MARFFVAPENVYNNDISIYNKEDVTHITKVLRLSVNDIITICDGLGKDYKVRIDDINKDEVKTSILESYDCLGEPPIHVTLFQGIPKAAKMEYIIQKTTELGIGKIVPVFTHRTIVKFDKPKAQQKKIERWQRIAYEAAKQCNRGKIPTVTEPITYKEALKQMSEIDLKMMPYEREPSNKLKNILRSNINVKNVGIFIGPEGGFEEKEVDQASKSGVNLVTLGPRILRTETAGMTTLAILMSEIGDI